MQLKRTLKIALAASAALFCAVTSAQTYPTKSVNIIIPFPPGGR